MEHIKLKVKVRVFTRSREACMKIAKDKPSMTKWFKDTTVPISESTTQTDTQKNYFYNYRKEI